MAYVTTLKLPLCILHACKAQSNVLEPPVEGLRCKYQSDENGRLSPNPSECQGILVQLIAVEKLTKVRGQNQCINDITLQLLNQANNLLYIGALAAEVANSIYVVLRGKILHLSPNTTPKSENTTQEIQGGPPCKYTSHFMLLNDTLKDG